MGDEGSVSRWGVVARFYVELPSVLDEEEIRLLIASAIQDRLGATFASSPSEAIGAIRSDRVDRDRLTEDGPGR